MVIDTLFFSVYKFPDQISFFFCWKLFFKEIYCPVGNGTPLQYFGLENPMDGGAW